MDFNHGTGHGVGYLLNVHEGPAGFHWRTHGNSICPFQKGMVITDEPGIYISKVHMVFVWRMKYWYVKVRRMSMVSSCTSRSSH